MPDSTTPSVTYKNRRRINGLMLAGGACASLDSGANAAEDHDHSIKNPLLWAVAYKQTAAEYYAICHQAYNLARM